MVFIQIILLLAYCIMPLPIKTIMLAGDIFIKDSIPVIDEIIMLLMYFNSVERTMRVVYFIHKHKVIIVILIVILLVFSKRIFGGE